MTNNHTKKKSITQIYHKNKNHVPKKITSSKKKFIYISCPSTRKSKEKKRLKKKRKEEATLMPKKKKTQKRWQLRTWLPRKRKKKKRKKKGQPYWQCCCLGGKKKPLEENMGIFVNQEKIHPYSIFSLFWRENILVGPRRKHLGPTIYFPSFLPNQTHSKKVFLPIFSSKFSIHPILPPNKHTLKLGTHGFS